MMVLRLLVCVLWVAFGLAACGGDGESANDSTLAFGVSGTVVGLRAGESLEVGDGHGHTETLTRNGEFAFRVTTDPVAGYALRVLRQPQAQQCTVANGHAPVVTGDLNNVRIACSDTGYRIGGTVSGLLEGQQLTLLNISTNERLGLKADGQFAFAVPVAHDGSYLVTVDTQPLGQTCSVAEGMGDGVVADVTTIQVKCSSRVYRIGGQLTGLANGGRVTLLNNGADALTLEHDGPFTFRIPVAHNGGYRITIANQPDGQTCSVAGGSGSGNGVVADIDDIRVSCSTHTYRIGGSVSGLGNGLQLTLHNNGGDTLTLRSDGVFFFPSPVAHGGSYRVTVGTQPNGQACTVAAGTGVQVIADVNSVVITCSVNAYRLAGRVSGLAVGKQVTLWNNGGDALTLVEDGPFAFEAPVAHGGSYNITVATQPVGQTCSVTYGQGIGVVQDVDDVSVACSVTTFRVGGILVGLGTGKQVTLLNSGGDHLPLTRDGGFTFRTPVAYGSAYDVSVGTQPTGQTCAVTEGAGSNVRADVSGVRVACAANLYTVGGTLQGLGASQRVRIQMNGGEVLTLTSNGTFSFSSRLHDGQYYGVRLLSQPIGSRCDISDSYGAAWGDVNSIGVTCVALSQNKNPVAPFDFPDPTVIHGDDGYYYAYATGGAIIRSPNLATWTYVGSYIQAPGWNWGTAGAGVWAPDILKLGGRYLLYYSLATWGDPNPGIGVAVANSPAGPWVDHGKLFTSSEIGVNNSIDPHAFVSDDGRVILAWGSMRGNFMVELSPDGLSLKDGVTAHQKKVQVAGLHTSYGWDGRTYEGAYVLRHGGFYYLFLSTGSCCNGLNSDYRVVVGRSASPTGPFVDHLGRDLRAPSVGYPVVAGTDMFRGPGHNTLSQDSNGDWWMLYHSWDSSSPGIGRALMVDRLNWNSNGWPSISGGGPHALPFQ